MAVSLTQLKENSVKIPVKYNNFTVNVELSVERMDADLVDLISEADKKGDTQGLRLLLSTVITGWDLYAKAENDFPPTVENIGQLPMLFINVLVKQVLELTSGNEQ